MLLVDCPWFSLACGSYAPDLGYGTRSIETSTHEDRFTCVHMYGLHIRINIMVHSSPVHKLYIVHELHMKRQQRFFVHESFMNLTCTVHDFCDIAGHHYAVVTIEFKNTKIMF